MASTLGFRYGCAKGMTFCHTLSTPESVDFLGALFLSATTNYASSTLVNRNTFILTAVGTTVRESDLIGEIM
jgi:hypothetical protein